MLKSPKLKTHVTNLKFIQINKLVDQTLPGITVCEYRMT